MGHGPSQVAALVAAISPWDATEREHQATALTWLASTQDIYRRVKPRTPSPHLVSYALLVDPMSSGASSSGASSLGVFLVDHRLSGLWLPAGGHVERFEDPVDTARREAMEELGISADLSIAGPRPLFITVTTTRGADPHTDVSLWYVLAGGRNLSITLDQREFAGGRWWTAAEIEAADPEAFDPHLPRFLAKLRTR